MQHFLSILQTPTPKIKLILQRALDLRSWPQPALLAGKTLVCLFEKPSLRTRVSFEQAMRKLGGDVMSMSASEVGLGGRESAGDVARVLSSMVDIVMARVLRHQTVEELAAASSVPVINGLSDRSHPAQALADVLTMIDEFSPGDINGLKGRSIVFVGDGNNVARSLASMCVKLGMHFVLCAPQKYDLSEDFLARVCQHACDGGTVTQCNDPAQGVRKADAVYGDTFISMGQEEERDQRLKVFSPYQINAELMAKAPPHAIVLHCLPASRGIEITDEMMDGPRSRVFRQAKNRMDGQIGLLATLLSR